MQANKQLKEIHFALLRSVIGLQNSHHFLNQRDVKPKPFMTRPHSFSRACHGLHVVSLVTVYALFFVFDTQFKTALPAFF